MTSLKINHDTRRIDADDEAPVKISVAHNGKTAYVSTNVKVSRENFSAKRGVVISGANVAFQNTAIQKTLLRCQKAVIELSDNGKLSTMSASDLKAYIDNGGEADGVLSFVQFFESEIEKKHAKGTRELYRNTLNHIRAFDAHADSLTFENITALWMRKFDEYLINKGIKINTRNINHRNIRAVFNAAIDNELTTAYPFRKFAIKNEPTAKRNLSVIALRFFYSMPLPPYDAYFRDMFFLSLFLIGINSVDLYNATDADGDRLIYKRAKTGKLYDIKIEPEAQAIINRYKGKNGKLVNVSERFANSRNFTKQIDKVLKRCVPGVSQYWCRHSWATLAAELDIPIETISAALGHSYGSRITNIYIEFNKKKIDNANRSVIDFLIMNKTKNEQIDIQM